jgi:hypothetical protein
MPDSNITLRSVKGESLSHTEMDANFRDLFYSASITGSTISLFKSSSGGTNPFTVVTYFDEVRSKPTLVSGSFQIYTTSSRDWDEVSASIASDYIIRDNYLSSSLAPRIANLEVFSSSLDATYATDAEVTTAVSTLSSSAHLRRNQIRNHTSASTHDNYLKNTTDTLTGDLTVTGTLTAQEFNTEYITSSVILESGSTKFGNSDDDTHIFTGSVNITGSTTITGNTNIIGALTASAIQATISGSIDQADNATTASYVLATNIDGTVANSTTASFATTASTVNFNGGLTTGSDVQFDSLGVGVAATGATGEIVATGDITAYYSSDERLKDNITPLSNALDKINQIGGYEFDWNSDSSHSGHDVGVIAQEIEKVLPEVVVDRDTGYKAVRYDKIVALLIQAVKEQQLQIDELKSKL